MKRKFIHRYLVLPAVLLLAGGCHSTDPVEEPAEEIRFAVSNTWQAMGEDATRAATVDSWEDLIIRLLHVDAYLHGTETVYFGNEQVDFDFYSGAWRFTSGVKYYWPNDEALDFYAYLPNGLSKTSISAVTYTAANGPGFTCTNLPVTSAGQAVGNCAEFMYAYTTNQTKDRDGATPKTGVDVGTVALQFHHPFAILYLDVKTAHRAIYRLNTIKFKNIKNNGSFTYGNSPQWTVSGDNTDITITLNQAVSADASLSAAQKTAMGCPIIVIPQSYTATNQIEVKLTWNDGDDEQTYTFNNPVSEWQPGKVYNYTLDLLGEIKFSVTIEDWSAEETPRNIRF